MSDLQIVLIALGALIIAGVIVYNWMQEKKLRNNIADEFIVPQKDVLAEDFYIDTDAFVDRELADIPNKIRITEKLNEPLAPPAIVDTPSISEKAPEAAPEAVATNAVQNEALHKLETGEAAMDKKIIEAPPANSITTASPLPDDIHPQIDLTAFLYATKNIGADVLKNAADNIADDMGVPMMLHGQDKDGKWHVD